MPKSVQIPQEGFLVSQQQERVWLLQANDKQVPYRVVALISVDGQLDVNRLKRAVCQLVERYEILRTSFARLAGSSQPVQVIHNGVDVQVDELSLADVDEATQEKRIESLLEEAKEIPFDFEKAPLIRVQIVTRSDDRRWLILVLPALCGDRESLRVGLAEICRSYNVTRDAGESGQDHLQYADFAQWQYDVLHGEDSGVGKTFWHSRAIADHTSVTLPYETNIAEIAEFRPAVFQVSVLPETLTRVHLLAEACSTSREVIFLSCWLVLLGRLSGTTDLSLGVRYAGRDHEDLRNAMGLFETFLPLRCGLDWNESFSDFVRRSHDIIGELNTWGDFFSWKDFGEFDGDGLRMHGFPYAFEAEEKLDTICADEVTFTVQQQYACTERFKIKLCCVMNKGEAATAFYYDSRAFQAGNVQRLAMQYHTLLADASERPEARVSDLNIIPNKERHRLVIEFNDTAAAYPRGRCIHEFIQEEVETSPDSVAVDCAGDGTSYGDLNVRANQLARYLRRLGVGPNVLVGICLERSLEMVVGVLGILKAGGAYVPFDPSYPKERLEFLQNDTKAPVVVTKKRFAPAVSIEGSRLVCLDDDWEAISRERRENPCTEVTPSDLVYVIYTSGSTGQPKGVMVTHQDLVISNSARISYFNQPVKKFMLLSSLSFDSSVVGIFWTLCTGGTLFLVPEDIQQDVARLASVIDEHQISHVLTLPSFYSLILEHAKPQQLTSLETAIVAGEACPKKLVEQHKALLKTTALFSEYGATETTVFSSVYDCRSQTLPIAPIGQPIANAQIYVLDRNLQPVPVGVSGEVYFGGDALAKGYLNRPDLTAERFIPNPFSKAPGARLYRSGDLARHLADGEVEFLGRVDNQVKIRGFRIELEEIEAVISQHPSVREAVVVAKDASEWQASVGQKENQRSLDWTNSRALVDEICSLEPERAELLLKEIDKFSELETARMLPPAILAEVNDNAAPTIEYTSGSGPARKIPARIRSCQDFDISLQLKNHSFIAPPRPTQRNHLINQALNEFVDDLSYLDVISKRFVPGSDFNFDEHATDLSKADLQEQQIMEDWQLPVARAMAATVTETQGDVLEIGFGRGIAASFIQEFGARSHTIIESNMRVLEQFYAPWKDRYPNKNIRLVPGKWQESLDQLDSYDAILFHTFPLSEEEFIRYVVNSGTFAEHFIPVAARLLRRGGILSYFSNEIDSLSRRHQRLILKYFTSLSVRVQPLTIPEDTKDLWWADSIVITKAVK